MTMALPVEPDPDLPVIEAVGQGDRDAFHELVRSHDRWIRGVIFGVLGDREAVEDVAQQVWAAVWGRIGELRNVRSWRPWLYRLARNAAVDSGRDRTRRKVLAAQVERQPSSNGSPATPTQALMNAELWAVVLDAIQSLPALYREPFVLRHLEEWSYREIAETMQIPVDTVETRLVRARRILRQALDGKV